MTTETAILRRAREIISDPDRWTQGVYARDGTGHPTEATSYWACRWCAAGAIAKAAVELGALPGDGACATDRLLKFCPPKRHVSDVNDEQGHSAVLALFDKALAQEAA